MKKSRTIWTVRIYGIIMVMLSLTLMVTIRLLSETHQLNAVWIVYLLGAVGLFGGYVAIKASRVPAETPKQFNEIINARGKCYHVCEDPITPGDWVMNVYTKDVDKCVEIFEDGTLGIEFTDGSFSRFVCSKHLYRKAKPV